MSGNLGPRAAFQADRLPWVVDGNLEKALSSMVLVNQKGCCGSIYRRMLLLNQE
jgi:hypothetical protein